MHCTHEHQKAKAECGFCGGDVGGRGENRAPGGSLWLQKPLWGSGDGCKTGGAKLCVFYLHL